LSHSGYYPIGPVAPHSTVCLLHPVPLLRPHSLMASLTRSRDLRQLWLRGTRRGYVCHSNGLRHVLIVQSAHKTNSPTTIQCCYPEPSLWHSMPRSGCYSWLPHLRILAPPPLPPNSARCTLGMVFLGTQHTHRKSDTEQLNLRRRRRGEDQ
jgi:hypothetical protein